HLFTGQGHAPAPPLAQETGAVPQGLAALDCPDWLAPALQDALGDDFAPVLTLLRQRAPVFLRVNLRRATRAEAQAALTAEGIATRPHPLADTALEVLENPRRIRDSQAFLQGLVELQDAASQALVAALPLRDGMRVLDYCAGGGGKALAMGARAGLRLDAHDADRRRMADLPARAARAGLRVRQLATADLPARGPWDLVLADAPCSGSGSWRRSPEGKWALTPARLDQLCRTQAQVLDAAARLVAPGGVLAYATCSLLQAENDDRIAAFLARSPGFAPLTRRVWTPLDGGDGFFLATLGRA
ncbi:MAG: RsmB/NOP family class I SAM-dependent RNA methyltransferase, partial [Rhodobacterales bacterium]|nr:RsmB/NOP family class I SAM-dependent RNA methyltransferase [Rhodobacterales bacterium]